jgi:predicted nuclease with RNAse H fold
MPPYAIRPLVCLGIDLAGVERRETGIALLRAGRLELLEKAASDADILAFAHLAGPQALVAINAPLTRPRGRCCLDDDCGCRQDPGTRSRQLERDLGRMRVPTLATTLLKVLARRGIRLAALLRESGWEPLEVYPYATLRLLGLPTAGKRTLLGRQRIQRALQALVPGLDHPDASEHQLDAVVCAYTAALWRQGLARPVGAADEGLVLVPDVPIAPALEAPRRLRQVAEAPAAYDVGSSELRGPSSEGSAPRNSELGTRN